MRNLTEILADKYAGKCGWSVSIDYDDASGDYLQKTIEEQYAKLVWEVEGVKKPTLEEIKKLADKKPKNTVNIIKVKKQGLFGRLIGFVLKYSLIISAIIIVVDKVISLIKW